MDSNLNTDLFVFLDGELVDEIINGGPEEYDAAIKTSFFLGVAGIGEVVWRFSNERVAALAHDVVREQSFLKIEVGDRDNGQPFLV